MQGIAIPIYEYGMGKVSSQTSADGVCEEILLIAPWRISLQHTLPSSQNKNRVPFVVRVFFQQQHTPPSTYDF